MSSLNVNEVHGSDGTGIPNNLEPITAGAWVNFQGTGAVSIRDQHNVTSITDVGTGIYVVNFTNAFANNMYSAVAQGATATIEAGDVTTTSVEINTFNSAGSRVDVDLVCLQVFGGLA